MDVIDELLANVGPHGTVDPDITAGLRRGQDFLSLSERADQGILDELFGQGDHRTASAQVANRSGLVAANEHWRQRTAPRKANGEDLASTTGESQPHTVDDLQDGKFKDAGMLGDVLRIASSDDPQNLENIGKSHVDSGAVKKWIGNQLTLGKTPSQVVAGLKRLAEQAVFDHQSSYDFLKDQAGLMGMSYIEPNQFHKDCKASLAYIRANGQLRTASVKEIAACKGCSECKCGADGTKKCATYNRPIVSNAKDLGRVVASLTGGTMKKAALVARHNGAAASVPGHAPNVITARTAPTEAPKVAGSQSGISHFDAAEFRASNSRFTPASVVASLNEGTTFAKIFAAAKLEYGTQVAERTCRAFLDSIKGSGQRINLASLDCSLLKRRLASTETILGASKCAGCTLRNSMHCGLTGGTLLSFPGMTPKGSNAKTASAAPAPMDVVATMQGMGMAHPEVTIDFSAPRNLMQVDVEGVPESN